VKAVISRSAWKRPPLFEWLQREGKVAEEEMLRVVQLRDRHDVVVSSTDAEAAAHALTASGETVFQIGRIEPRKPGELAVRCL